MCNATILTTIRTATCADIPQILAIQEESFADGHICARQWRYLMTKAKGRVLVAQDDNTLLGYLVLLAPKHSKSCRVYTIAVAYSQRRAGVGSQLIEQAKRAALAFQKTRLHLEMRTSSRSLSAFYQHLNFRRLQTLTNYYGAGKDGVRMFCEASA